MNKPNLNKIIQDNLDDKLKAQSKQSGLPKNSGWLDKYESGGIYLSDRAKATQFGQYKNGGNSDGMLTNPNNISTYFPRMQYAGQTSQQDSLRHLAGQTMDYEARKGSPTGTDLSDWGYHSSQLPFDKVLPTWKPPKTKEEAVDLYMKEIGSHPTLTHFNTAMEKGEPGEEMLKSEVENFTQKQLLDKNHQERYLQEIVDYAGKRGDVNKVRIPTSETAAKVQGYNKVQLNKIKNFDSEGINQVVNDALKNKGKSFEEYIDSKGFSIKDIPENELETVQNMKYIYENPNLFKKEYLPEHQTILKKYSEQPKIIKKLFGKEPTIVTDSKGNTWYEFDIPESFKKGKGEIKAFKKGGVIKDNRGQWDHPGEITEIDSDNITMQGVPYPVLGVGADGQQIMMQPGQDYRFNQGPVTEYPMAQSGGDISIPNLKNNWLTKYLKYK